MLEARNLKKTFGKLKAVDDVSFKLEDGKILGLIGQNGSGKTTMFRMILNLLTPEDNGEVLWNGKALKDEVYNTVGYLPEERGLYDKLTIERQITYFAELRGMNPKETSLKIDEWMKKFNVKGSRKDLVKTLSKGNQQKVQLIATLIHEPKLIILDEPFSGLDPVNADYLKKGIFELREKGSSIIFSSHNMNNVEEICDALLMIHNGKQVLYGTVDDVKNSFGRTRLYLEGEDLKYEDFEGKPGITKVIKRGQGKFTLHVDKNMDKEKLFSEVTKGKYVETFSHQPPTLEEIFKMKAQDTNIDTVESKEAK